MTEIADVILDTIENYGPSSIVHEGTPEIVTTAPTEKFFATIGGHGIDFNGSINDFAVGLHETFGKFSPVSSADDWFNSELILIWHMNPVYTRIPFFHFIAEARYHGTDIVNISPDINPSHMHADMQVPINSGTDAAFALALVQVMFTEGLINREFMKEQTDLAFLVRVDSGRYLRECDILPNGREDQMYHWSSSQGLTPANRASMTSYDPTVVLEGAFDVTLASGKSVRVRPACSILKERLDAHFTPELQQSITGVHPSVVRTIARKVASRRTNILLGFNASKYFHGDLIERAMCLVLAASGNWGRHGTGIRSWAAGMHDGHAISTNKPMPGAEAAARIIEAREAMIGRIKAREPAMTTELAARRLAHYAASMRAQRFGIGGPPASSSTSVPVFWWLQEAGFGRRWNTPDWTDYSLPRTFAEYMAEAVSKGWWEGKDGPGSPPRILVECGGNMLRRTRGGKAALLPTLWQQLTTVVVIDFRMTQTAMYSDYVLPAAQHYEKIAFHIPTPHVMNLTFSDKSVDPAGEAKSEWEIYHSLLEAVAEQARKRGLTDYRDEYGAVRNFADLPGRFSMNGFLLDPERRADEEVRDSVMAGTLPNGTDLRAFRQLGHVRFTDWGTEPMALAQASPILPNEPHVPFRDHVERGVPFPTYARRAQFYIDHDWFLEAGEELPTYKPNPTMGGHYPLRMTSGHGRWSIHAMNQANSVMLGTHRGEPHLLVSPEDARARGVTDDELVHVWNDAGSFTVRTKISSGVRQGQVVSYNGWDGFQYDGWSGANELEPGMVKPLALAGGYGHLRHLAAEWQPVPADRWVSCDFRKVSESSQSREVPPECQ